jgi:MoaA/NifB/PqqE/SkfB family radical SAM enzyme
LTGIGIVSDEPVYRKHNSFVAIRQSRGLDVSDRIRSCAESLPGSGLSAEASEVVRRACQDLLDDGDSAPELRFTLHAAVAEEIRRLGDDELPRYLYYRYRYEIYPKSKVVDAFPPCIQVEPTSVCNYRCVFCYQTDMAFTRKSSGHMGMMPLTLFREIVDEIAGNVEALTLASRGEPLANPAFDQMAAYARGKFLAFKVNTNASYLNERLCHAILESGVNTIVFSADAASEPAYSRFRVGGKLDAVLGNVRLFRDIRARHYPRSRTITRVSGVKVPGTPDLDEMEDVWGDLVDQVAFVSYNPWENAYQREPNTIGTPCSDLWRRTFVWWDGRVNPCDVDYKSMLSVGGIPEEGIGELWRGEAYTELRRRHLERQRLMLSPCRSCVVV